MIFSVFRIIFTKSERMTTPDAYSWVKTYTTMKNIISYTAILAFALTAPLSADIVNPAPVPNAAGMRGNCDLLASNTVRASFVGLRDMPVQTVEQDAPTMVQVAVFEVIDSLGYRKYVRYGDGQLTAGTRFTVAMNKELPGQPASIVDTISQMQPGEEAVLKIDHLYLLGGREGTPIRACSRMARRNAQPMVTPGETPADANAQTSAPALPTSVAPLGGGMTPQQPGQPQYTAQSSRVMMQMDGNGNMQTIQIRQQTDTNGQTTTRMFINGVEVDPQTRQPLNSAAPQPAAPQDAAAEQKAAAEDSNDDTIVDKGPEIPQPQPVTPTVPQQTPTTQPGGQQNISEADSF